MPEQFSPKDVEQQIVKFQDLFNNIATSISQAIVGQREIIQDVVIAFLAGGHVLLEGLPGLGKTLLVERLTKSVSADYGRIQFTPDLMPADIIGTKVIMEDKKGQKGIQFEQGPIFANIVLADEINRATPKTQSALLQAMQEHKVTIANTTYNLPDPFMVVATQNPIDMEGTYPLPEAQLDRFFFKLEVSFPSKAELIEIAQRTTQGQQIEISKPLDLETLLHVKKIIPGVCIGEHLLEYAASIICNTHPYKGNPCGLVNRYTQYGSSPRGMQALVLGAKTRALYHKRVHVSTEDIQRTAAATLRHRIILNFEGEAEGITTNHMIAKIIENTKVKNG